LTGYRVRIAADGRSVIIAAPKMMEMDAVMIGSMTRSTVRGPKWVTLWTLRLLRLAQQIMLGSLLTVRE